MSRVDLAELRRLWIRVKTITWGIVTADESQRQEISDVLDRTFTALPALLDELEAAQEEVRRLKQDLDGFKPVGGDFIKAAKAIGAAEELEGLTKALLEDLADMDQTKSESCGKTTPSYRECLRDITDGLTERAAQLRREAGE